MNCPYCHKSERWKWNRPRWMRWTPGPMELWRCASCGKEFTVWWWVFPLRNHVAHGLVVAWRIVIVLIILFFISFVSLPV